MLRKANRREPFVTLEKGTFATPFEFRPYDVELRTCQRYFTQFGGNVQFQRFGWGSAYSTTQASVNIPLYTLMRASPSSITMNNYTYFFISYGGTSTAVTALTVDQAATDLMITVNLTSSGLTVGQFVYLNTTSLSARILISADI